MDGFDDAGVFYSDNFGKSVNHDGGINLQATKKKYKEFLRSYHEDGFNFKYRYLYSFDAHLCPNPVPV